MDKEQLIDKIEEIQDKNWNTFKGSNEYQLHTRVEVADYVETLLNE